MKYIITGLLLTVLSLIACIDSNTSGGSGGGIAMDVTEVNQIIEANPQFFVIPNVEITCNFFGAETTTTQDTITYQLVNGQLHAGEKNECTKLVFTGTSTTLQGTWVSDLSTVPSNIPNCDSSDIGELKEFMTNPQMTVVITETSFSQTITGNLCFANALRESLDEQAADTTFGDFMQIKNVSTTGCNNASYTIHIPGFDEITPPIPAKDVPVSIAIKDLGNDQIQMTHNIDGCIAQGTVSKNDAFADEDCNDSEEPSEMDKQIEACMAGIWGDNGAPQAALEKLSAASSL